MNIGSHLGSKKKVCGNKKEATISRAPSALSFARLSFLLVHTHTHTRDKDFSSVTNTSAIKPGTAALRNKSIETTRAPFVLATKLAYMRSKHSPPRDQFYRPIVRPVPSLCPYRQR